MSREIGSEFHSMPFEEGNGLKFPRKGSLVFSGRTAAEAVLTRLPQIRTALLPSYCCDSMIEPFRKAGINVRFFRVEYRNGLRISINQRADLLLWCNYFGFHMDMPDFDGIIIEDITHSLLSEVPSHKRSDYLVASVRKWEPVYCGGYCSVPFQGAEPPEEYMSVRRNAMMLKTKYLEDGDEEKKAVFYPAFNAGNRWLAKHYSGLSIDSWSAEFLARTDVDNQRRIRRRNAHILYEGLKEKVRFLFREEEMDCPLFVPVLLPDRDKVRDALIAEKIYCPVHWTRPDGCESNIYDQELSLICDQRYQETDMQRIVSVLRKL